MKNKKAFSVFSFALLTLTFLQLFLPSSLRAEEVCKTQFASGSSIANKQASASACYDECKRAQAGNGGKQATCTFAGKAIDLNGAKPASTQAQTTNAQQNQASVNNQPINNSTQDICKTQFASGSSIANKQVSPSACYDECKRAQAGNGGKQATCTFAGKAIDLNGAKPASTQAQKTEPTKQAGPSSTTQPIAENLTLTPPTTPPANDKRSKFVFTSQANQAFEGRDCRNHPELDACSQNGQVIAQGTGIPARETAIETTMNQVCAGGSSGVKRNSTYPPQNREMSAKCGCPLSGNSTCKVKLTQNGQTVFDGNLPYAQTKQAFTDLRTPNGPNISQLAQGGGTGLDQLGTINAGGQGGTQNPNYAQYGGIENISLVASQGDNQTIANPLDPNNPQNPLNQLVNQNSYPQQCIAASAFAGFNAGLLAAVTIAQNLTQLFNTQEPTQFKQILQGFLQVLQQQLQQVQAVINQVFNQACNPNGGGGGNNTCQGAAPACVVRGSGTANSTCVNGQFKCQCQNGYTFELTGEVGCPAPPPGTTNWNCPIYGRCVNNGGGNPSNGPTEAQKACSSNNDCSTAPGICSCSIGGGNFAINKNFKDQFAKEIETYRRNSDGIGCPAVISNNPSCNPNTQSLCKESSGKKQCTLSFGDTNDNSISCPPELAVIINCPQGQERYREDYTYTLNGQSRTCQREACRPVLSCPPEPAVIRRCPQGQERYREDYTYTLNGQSRTCQREACRPVLSCPPELPVIINCPQGQERYREDYTYTLNGQSRTCQREACRPTNPNCSAVICPLGMPFCGIGRLPIDVRRPGACCPDLRCPSPSPTSTPSPTGSPTPTDAPVFCTQDVQRCPDGSFVGRIPPNCEFAPCPTTPTTPTPIPVNGICPRGYRFSPTIGRCSFQCPAGDAACERRRRRCGANAPNPDGICIPASR